MVDKHISLRKIGFLSNNKKVNQNNCLIRGDSLIIFGGDPTP